MADNALDLQPQVLQTLKSFTEALDQKIHLLATDGDEQLSQIAAQVTKQLFDLGESYPSQLSFMMLITLAGVDLEQKSHPYVHPFLAAITQPTPIELRSTTKKGKCKASEPAAPARLVPDEVLPFTPLSELTTEGLEPSQIWQQLELRAPAYVRVSKEITHEEQNPGMDEIELEHSEDGSEGSMTEEEFREMLAEEGLDNLTEEEIAEMMQDAEDSDEGSEDDEGDSEDGSDEDEEDDEDDEDDDEDEGLSMSGSEDDEVMFEDGTKIGGSDEDDDDDLEGDEGEDDEDESMLEDDEGLEDLEDSGEDASEDEDESGPSRAGPSKRRQHPELDDQFFSIDDFNRQTEEAEAAQVGTGRLDEDEEEELDEDVGNLMLGGAGEDAREFSPPSNGLKPGLTWQRLCTVTSLTPRGRYRNPHLGQSGLKPRSASRVKAKARAERPDSRRKKRRRRRKKRKKTMKRER